METVVESIIPTTPRTDIHNPAPVYITNTAREEDTQKLRGEAAVVNNLVNSIKEEAASIPEKQISNFVDPHTGQVFEVQVNKPPLHEIANNEFDRLRRREKELYLAGASAEVSIESALEKVAGAELEELERKRRAEEFYNIIRDRTGKEIQEAIEADGVNWSHEEAALLAIRKSFKEDPRFKALKEKDASSQGNFLSWAGSKIALNRMAEARDKANSETARKEALKAINVI